jgi:hypothetical protein
MPRNRMIKPDFWGDEKMATQLSKPARLLYIALWNFSDDYGVVKGNTLWLKRTIFGYEEDTIDTFKGWLKEIQDLKLIFPFHASDEKYYFIKNFLKHQTINRPSKFYRNPEPPKDILKIRPISEDSVSDHDSLTTEGKGKGKVKLKGNAVSEDSVSTPDTLNDGDEEHEKESAPFFEINSDDEFKLKELCKHLESKNIFSGVVDFTTEMIKKRNIHPKTMIHVLEKAKKKGTFDDTRGGVKAYCQKIIIVEDPNYHEKDHIDLHDGFKKKTLINPDVKKLVGNIGGMK